MPNLIQILTSNQAEFRAVVPFNPGKDKLLQLDFTEGNKEISEDIFNNTRVFCEYINHKLEQHKSRYGIGGYGEYRTIYRGSKIFDGGSPYPLNKGLGGEVEPRRLHIGIDIWGKHHTAISAPLNGIVHSFAYNDGAGNYGATIILSHQLEGTHFYTLYGHLSLNSIKNVREGDRIERGDIFAEFGSPDDNGQWPPHLHFQVIADLQGWNGDYPGVCAYSEREAYMKNCPDPDLILQMNQYIS